MQTLLGTPQTVTPPPTPPANTSGPPATPPLAWGKEIRRIHGEREGQIFMDRIMWTAWKLTQEQGGLLFDANWLMACMAFETGRKFSANVKNPASSATGLIQFMKKTAEELGTTTAKLAAMKTVDQINYVYRYFSQKIKERGPITSLDDCYMAILWPAAVGKPAEHGIFVNPNSTYKVNAGLDKNRDGKVTKAEAASKVHEQLMLGMSDANFG